MKPLRSWAMVLMLVSALAPVMACDGFSPTAPQPRTAPQPPVVPAEFVRVEGLAIDADTDQPISGARISTIQVLSGGRYGPVSHPASTTAGSDGRFVLVPKLQSDWRDLMLEVAGTGYETARVYTNSVDTTLRAYRTTTIQPGQSIELRVFLGHYVCGFESHQCRRIVVDVPEGELVDLEVIPADSRDVTGLIVDSSEPGWPFSGHQPRVTAPAGPVWIIGGGIAPSPGRVTLTATRR